MHQSRVDGLSCQSQRLVVLEALLSVLESYTSSYTSLCIRFCGWHKPQMFFLTKQMNTLAKDFLKSNVLLQWQLTSSALQLKKFSCLLTARRLVTSEFTQQPGAYTKNTMGYVYYIIIHSISQMLCPLPSGFQLEQKENNTSSLCKNTFSLFLHKLFSTKASSDCPSGEGSAQCSTQALQNWL